MGSMRVLDKMPGPIRPRKQGLRKPQIRVLQLLNRRTVGALTRSKIATRLHLSQVRVGKIVGRRDPKKRTAFEQTRDGGFRPSLLTLGLVRQVRLDIDGVTEIAIEITTQGRQALAGMSGNKVSNTLQH